MLLRMLDCFPQRLEGEGSSAGVDELGCLLSRHEGGKSFMEVAVHKENGTRRSKEGDGPETQMFGKPNEWMQQEL